MTRLTICITTLMLSFNLYGQISNLDNFIENELALENIPGVAACVVKKGKVVWQGTYGFANLEDQTPVDTETMFTLASISKLFVGTAIVQLEEAGQLDLDDDINEYLNFDISNPHFPNQIITFRQLLQHRSSLKDSENLLYDLSQQGDASISLAPYLEDHLSVGGVAYTPTIFNSEAGPGQSTWYSNFGFGLLGYLVEVIAEMPYHQYVRENILDPLCMEESSFFFDDIDVSNYAIPYKEVGNENNPLGTYGFPNYPAALLKSNIKELAYFLMAHTQRGAIDENNKLFSSASADLLTPYNFLETNLAWWNGTTWTYTAYAPNEEVWFHGGFMHGIRTRMNYYPQDSSGIIILTNGEGQYRWIEDTLQQYIPDFSLENSSGFPCMITTNDEAIIVPKNQVLIYPNPLKNSAFLSTNLNGRKTFMVYNLIGKIVLKEHSLETKNHHFNVTNWPQGVYHFTLKDEKGHVQSGKFIIP